MTDRAEKPTPMNCDMDQYWGDDERVFYDLESFKIFMDHNCSFKKKKLTERVVDHFAKDWTRDCTLEWLGMTAICPILYVDLHGVERVMLHHVSDAVLCVEGMITGDEIRLAESRSGLIPSLSGIAESAKGIRESWNGPQTIFEQYDRGFSGPGIRECVVMTSRTATSEY